MIATGLTVLLLEILLNTEIYKSLYLYITVKKKKWFICYKQ